MRVKHVLMGFDAQINYIRLVKKPNCLVFMIDCKKKRLEYDVAIDDGSKLVIMFTESGSDGHQSTTITATKKEEKDLFQQSTALVDWHKYGCRIYLVPEVSAVDFEGGEDIYTFFDD